MIKTLIRMFLNRIEKLVYYKMKNAFKRNMIEI